MREAWPANAPPSVRAARAVVRGLMTAAVSAMGLLGCEGGTIDLLPNAPPGSASCPLPPPPPPPAMPPPNPCTTGGAPCPPMMRQCEPLSGRCVQCLGDTDCKAGHPFCRTSDFMCVECRGSSDCDPRKTCDLGTNRCLAPCSGPMD